MLVDFALKIKPLEMDFLVLVISLVFLTAHLALRRASLKLARLFYRTGARVPVLQLGRDRFLVQANPCLIKLRLLSSRLLGLEPAFLSF